jgi:hypothetical protein
MTPDMPALYEQAVVLAQAKRRITETDGYQAVLTSRYRKLHAMYAPLNDDQWPNDLRLRPGKIHITSNIVKPAVDIDARLQAKLPRITLDPMDLTQKERARAETVEKFMQNWLKASGWELWLNTLTRGKSLYGKGVIKAFWNSEEKRPDAFVLENPANLRIGWGASDFSIKDWAIYEYALSPEEVTRRWPNVEVLPPKERGGQLIVQLGGDHGDPLAQKDPNVDLRPRYLPSDYEQKQVKVWDYWYKSEKTVKNCVILQGLIHAVPPTAHAELLDIPYVVVENDHEPGSPEGISTASAILDIQEELNRALSHEGQLVADEIDPSWQLVGDNADSVPTGLVPKSGEIVAPGGGSHIEPINKPINTFPADQFITHLWDQFHKTTGLGPIAFGIPSSSQESGQSLAIQADAYANRLDPRRALLYSGMKELLILWTVMVERLNPKINVDGPNGKPQSVGLGKLFKGFRAWTIIGPEVTPKDLQAHTMNEINKLNAGVQSARSTMDNLGIDSPEDELKTIGEENSNLALNPGKVQAQMAVWAAMQQYQINQEQFAQMIQGLNPGTGSATGAAQDQTGNNNALAQAQQAQPAVGPEQNQPATGAGSPPPPGAPAPGGTATTLVRSGPQGQQTTLNQLALNRRF